MSCMSDMIIDDAGERMEIYQNPVARIADGTLKTQIRNIESVSHNPIARAFFHKVKKTAYAVFFRRRYFYYGV